jgi:hypothetical protein
MSYLDSLPTSPAAEPFTFSIDGVDEPECVFQTPLSPAPGDHSANTSAPSFESILSGKSVSPFSRVAFADFLRKIHCSENLEFLISADNYLTTTDDTTRKHLWHYIYTNFISTYSLKEVNIPHDVRATLNGYFENDALPCDGVIIHSMNVIKELLRDAYFQFIQHVRRLKRDSYFSDTANSEVVDENYSLFPTPTDEEGPSTLRRMSEHDPLDTRLPSARCVSPLSASEMVLIDVRQRIIPRSSDAIDYSSDDSREKKDSVSSSKSLNTKNSSFTESTGLKKLAGKFRWRRMSSNSSSGSQ